MEGFLAQLFTTGARDVAIIRLTSRISTSSAASFLFTFNIIKTLFLVSNTPLASHSPRFASLLAVGRVSEFRKLFFKPCILTLGVLSLAGMSFVFLGNYLLSFINSNKGMWSPYTLLVLIFLMSVERFQTAT